MTDQCGLRFSEKKKREFSACPVLEAGLFGGLPVILFGSTDGMDKLGNGWWFS